MTTQHNTNVETETQKKQLGRKRTRFTKARSFTLIDGMVKPATRGKPNLKVTYQVRQVPWDFDAKSFTPMSESEANNNYPITEMIKRVAKAVTAEVNGETQPVELEKVVEQHAE